MQNETEAGKPEGKALPEIDTNEFVTESRFDHIETEVRTEISSIEQRVRDAIEAWYAKHFHAAAVAGLPTLSADDKAALIQHVAEAVAPTQE
jgi:hypothetical protein